MLQGIVIVSRVVCGDSSVDAVDGDNMKLLKDRDCNALF